MKTKINYREYKRLKDKEERMEKRRKLKQERQKLIRVTGNKHYA